MHIHIVWYVLDYLAPSYSFGYDSTRVSNLEILEKDIVAYVAGAFLVIQNTKTNVQKYIHAIGHVCFGAVTVSTVSGLTRVGVTRGGN